MKITDAQLKQIYAHAAETYPNECFGFLVGLPDDGGRVHAVVRGANLRTDRADRYEMDGAEFARVEKKADEEGLRVIGFYHSHPDWPAIPSQSDLNGGWEGSYYLIVSMHEGRPLNAGVWALAPDAPKRFKAEPLEILDETASG